MICLFDAHKLLNSELRHLDGIRTSASASQLHRIIPIYSFLFLFPHFAQTNGFPTSRKSISVLGCRYDIYASQYGQGSEFAKPHKMDVFIRKMIYWILLVWVHLISFVPNMWLDPFQIYRNLAELPCNAMAKRLRLKVPDPVGWFFRTGLTKGPPSSNTKIMKDRYVR